MSINYIFPTNINPEASFWNGALNNVVSNGNYWIFTGGQAASLSTDYIFTINSTNDLVVEVTFNMPSTGGSYNGLTISTLDHKYQFRIVASWEKNNGNYWILDIVNNTKTWVDTGISAGTQIKAKIVFKKDGSGEAYVNDILRRTVPVGSFSNQAFSITLTKYTETTGYVYSGYIQSPIVEDGGGENFMTFFNQYL